MVDHEKEKKKKKEEKTKQEETASEEEHADGEAMIEKKRDTIDNCKRFVLSLSLSCFLLSLFNPLFVAGTYGKSMHASLATRPRSQRTRRANRESHRLFVVVSFSFFIS